MILVPNPTSAPLLTDIIRQNHCRFHSRVPVDNGHADYTATGLYPCNIIEDHPTTTFSFVPYLHIITSANRAISTTLRYFRRVIHQHPHHFSFSKVEIQNAEFSAFFSGMITSRFEPLACGTRDQPMNRSELWRRQMYQQKF